MTARTAEHTGLAGAAAVSDSRSPGGPLPPPVRAHLAQITGQLGIYQHARASVPDPGQGYCTDDVARAAIVDVVQGRVLGHRTIAESLDRNLAFLASGFVGATGRMRNFRDDDGNWLEREGSPDAHARAVRALGLISAEPGLSRSAGRTARRLLEHLLPAAPTLAGLRPWAHVILGCVSALDASQPPPLARQVLTELGARLVERFDETSSDWPWPEAVVTYENALLAQALIEGGEALGDRLMVQRGLDVLSWLLHAQIEPPGFVVLVGNRGWWPRDGSRARYDQQPIDAQALVEACAAAWRVDRDPAWSSEMERSYAWFGGLNSVGLAVADPLRGSCGDGLTAVGVSANQGAESTLAWLAATECVRAIRLATTPASDSW